MEGGVKKSSNNSLVFQDEVLWWLSCKDEQEVIGEASTPSACQKGQRRFQDSASLVDSCLNLVSEFN